MAGMLKMLVVPLATWAVGCSAAGGVPKSHKKKCADGYHGYYGAQEFINRCYEFCVPEGKCQAHVDKGHMHRLGIREAGGCAENGYPLSSEFGEISSVLREYVDKLEGSCAGLQLLGKFRAPSRSKRRWPAQVPVPPAFEVPNAEMPIENPMQPPADESPEPQRPDDHDNHRRFRIPWGHKPPQRRVGCSDEQLPYVMFAANAGDTCTEACVPEGACVAEADTGAFDYIGLGEQGECADKGFTEAVNTDDEVHGYFTVHSGKCKGTIRFHKYEKPTLASTISASSLCKPGQTPFMARPTKTPDVCSVYCIPNGDCEGQARAGHLSHFGIIKEGACDTEGFTARMAHQTDTEWFEHVKGPCAGMSVVNFQQPPLVE